MNVKETAVKCDTFSDYLIVRGLYLKAGCPHWPWHKGYVKPDDDIHHTPYYGWEDCGFLKHIGCRPEKVITLRQLMDHVYND